MVYQGCLSFEEVCLMFLANKYCNDFKNSMFYQYFASLLDILQVHSAYSAVLKGSPLEKLLLNKSELYCLVHQLGETIS